MGMPGPAQTLADRRKWCISAVVAFTAAFALAVLSAAPGAQAISSPSSSARGQKSTFTVGLKQDLDSLNPFTGITVSAYETFQLNYDQLTDYGQKDFSARPALAETWDVSADGLTWTYHIRSGVKWSDGQPLTARDVAYTFNRVLNGTYEKTNFGTYVAALTSVEAPDDQTVVMKVKKPTPVMLHLTVYILPEHIWKDVDDKEVSSFTNEPGREGIVGSGPFIVKEHKKGQFVRLEANKAYWRGAPHIDELVFRIFSNDDSLGQALRRGDIDFADDVGANVFNSLKNAPGVTTIPAQYGGFNEIAMNTGAALDDGTPIGNGHPALRDKRVRVAIAHAIDTEALLARVFGGYGSPGTSIIPALYADLHYDPGSAAHTFDLAEANRLLDEAGYTKGANGIRTMPDGSRPLTFRLLGRSSSTTSQQSVAFVSGWLRDVGIQAQPEIVSEDALTEIIGEGTFDMFEWGWVVEADPSYQLSTFTCANRSRSGRDGGGVVANLSDSFYCNEDYDALYAKQGEQINRAARAETVKAMQKMLYDDAPYVITAYYDNLEAYRSDRFTDFSPQPAPGGSLLFQYGSFSYLSLKPVTRKATAKATTNADESGSSSGLVVGGVVVGGVVVGAALIGGLVLLGLRGRRHPDSDVE